MCGSSLEPAHITTACGRTMRPEGGPLKAGLGSELKDPVSLQGPPAWVGSTS